MRAGLGVALASLGVMGLALACSPEPSQPVQAPEPWQVELPPFELRDVVSARIAALEAQLAESQEPEWEVADPGRIEGLLQLLAGRDRRMRSAAIEEAEGLGQRCDEQLTTLINDQAADQAIRSAAVELLALVGGPSAGEDLLGYLETSEESWLRTHAAWRLGQLGEDWVIPRMLLRFKYEHDIETVIWLAKSLGQMGNFSGLSALQAAADASQDEVLVSSAYARMLEIAKAAEFEDVESLWEAWTLGSEALQQAEPERTARFQLEVWRRIERFVEFQLRGVDDSRFVLQRMGCAAARLMGEALADRNGYVRVGVAQSLQRMGPRAWVAGDELIRGLADTDLGPWAAEALGAIGAIALPKGQAALMNCLALNLDPELRLSAIRALGGYAAAPAAPTLGRLREVLARTPEAALASGERAEPEEFRQAAAESLLALGQTEGVLEPLLDWMTSRRVSPVSSQRALRGWLETNRQEPRFSEVIERWDALTIPAQTVVSAEERAAAKAAQASLVREVLPSLLDSIEGATAAERDAPQD